MSKKKLSALNDVESDDELLDIEKRSNKLDAKKKKRFDVYDSMIYWYRI